MILFLKTYLIHYPLSKRFFPQTPGISYIGEGPPLAPAISELVDGDVVANVGTNLSQGLVYITGM